MELPGVKKADMHDALQRPEPPPTTMRSISLRVLLVEDHDECRDTLGLLLEMEGMRVVATASGCHAARLAREERFDVIFTAFHLMDVPGTMLIRELVGVAVGRPRIAVITEGGDADIVSAMEAGAETVFRKPFLWADMALYLSGFTSPGAAVVV